MYVCIDGQGRGLCPKCSQTNTLPPADTTSVRKCLNDCQMFHSPQYFFFLIVILLLNPLLVLSLNSQSVRQAVRGSRGPPVAEIERALWSKEQCETQEYSVKRTATAGLYQEPHLCTGHSTSRTHLFTCIWEQTLLPEIEICQFSRSVLSVSLRPHGLQHASLPCPSPTPQSLLKLTSIKSVMPSNHFILCRLLLLYIYIYIYANV